MRLIDADRLMNDFLCTFYNNLDDQNRTERLINEAPTVERPHGEWKQITGKDGEYYCYHKCTNCGQTIESGFDNPPLFNYCPNCGAQMGVK